MQEQNASSSYNRRSNLIETVVYKSFQNRKNFGIQNISIEATDNSDGEHLRIAAKNLMKYGNKNKIIFYITDGKPFLTDCNLDILDSDLIRTIKWLKDNKITLYALGFNKSAKKFYKENHCFIENTSDMLKFFYEKL